MASREEAIPGRGSASQGMGCTKEPNIDNSSSSLNSRRAANFGCVAGIAGANTL